MIRTSLSVFAFGVMSLAVAHAQTRVERDLLGELQLPADAYYGVQTARALNNFKMSGLTTRFYPDYVRAFAMVKLASARANADVGVLSSKKLVLIEKACDAVIKGKYHEHFHVDLYQGGAGTSANMNANEVLANIGLELGGYSKGDYHTLEPHDDLNNGQSTNDVYPTAIKVALLLQHDPLVRETEALVDALRSKGRSFKEILKMGRTEGQDAVPMTLGQEFNAFAAQLEDALSLLKGAEQGLLTVNMGATAIGTGITAAPGYAKKCAKHLARITGKDVVLAEDLIAATTSMQGFVHYSSALKNMAVVISKIASDLILLSTGPRAGLFEINLPAMQPGSSIMPGKVNPVMPELMNIVAFKVMGNDVTVGIASHAGQLQLNAYEPVIALSLLESQRLFTNGFSTFREKCINGITANEKVTKRYIETSVGVVTALNPVLGYEKTTELASEALSSGKGIIELVREKKLLSESEIQKLLDPASMTGQN